MGFEDVLRKIGDFGPYQRRVYLLLCLPVILCAIHKLAGVFLNAKMHTRCRLPWENENATFHLSEAILNASYPRDDHGYSQCIRRTNLTALQDQYGNDSSTRNGEFGSYLLGHIDSQEFTSCKDYVFDTSTYKSTTTSDWLLVCDDEEFRTIGDSLFMIGVMLGSMIFGGLSDRFGRRPTFFLSLVIQLIGGILVAISPGYTYYVIFRMIVGAASSGVFLVAYVTALEMVGAEKRPTAGVGCQLFFTTGYLLMAVFAYFITDWRYLQIAITLPSVLFLVYWWFIPESARWLLSNGKDEEGREILQRAAHENGVELASDTLNDILKSNCTSTPDLKKASFFDLFKNSYLRKKCLLLFFNWLVNSSTYYGLSFHASNLGGNDHLNFFISGLVEIPAYTFLICTLNRWGRKKILCSSMIVAGVALIATLFFPPDHVGVVVFAMIGKLAISASYGTIYIFSAEQLPTVVRNVGMGACSTCAKFGGAIAPFINYSSKIWKPFPLVIFGVCALAGGVLSLLLPETVNKKLPDTIQDITVYRLQRADLREKKKQQEQDLKQLDVRQLDKLGAEQSGTP